MHRFADISAVEGFLHELAARPDGALVVELSRLPGTRETRWAQLLSDRRPPKPSLRPPTTKAPATKSPPLRRDLARMQGEIDALEGDDRDVVPPRRVSRNHRPSSALVLRRREALRPTLCNTRCSLSQPPLRSPVCNSLPACSLPHDAAAGTRSSPPLEWHVAERAKALPRDALRIGHPVLVRVGIAAVDAFLGDDRVIGLRKLGVDVLELRVGLRLHAEMIDPNGRVPV